MLIYAYSIIRKIYEEERQPEQLRTHQWRLSLDFDLGSCPCNLCTIQRGHRLRAPATE